MTLRPDYAYPCNVVQPEPSAYGSEGLTGGKMCAARGVACQSKAGKCEGAWFDGRDCLVNC